jgi:hypothetical protein
MRLHDRRMLRQCGFEPVSTVSTWRASLRVRVWWRDGRSNRSKRAPDFRLIRQTNTSKIEA